MTAARIDPVPRRISLIITTYEWPAALGLVLASVGRQSRLPDEVIVADDGSGASTTALLDAWCARLDGRLQRVWQRNEGFRAARVRNVGLAVASGDYVIFLDGDMVLHPAFVADYAAAARRGQWVQGVRPRLSPARTEAILAGGDPDLRWWQPGLEHRLHALRGRWLARVRSRRCARLASVKSCNQGYWREDLVRVNGFDERFVGWGPEGKELAARLEHAGVECLYLKHAAVAFHLWHPTRAPSTANPNDRLLDETLATHAVRCELGLDGHAAQPAVREPLHVHVDDDGLGEDRLAGATCVRLRGEELPAPAVGAHRRLRPSHSRLELHSRRQKPAPVA